MEENVEKQNLEESTDGAQCCMSVLAGQLEVAEGQYGMLLGCSHPL